MAKRSVRQLNVLSRGFQDVTIDGTDQNLDDASDLAPVVLDVPLLYRAISYKLLLGEECAETEGR